MTEPVRDADAPATDADVFVVPYDRSQRRRAISTGTVLMIISAALSSLIAVAIGSAMCWAAFQDEASSAFRVLTVVVTVLVAAIVWFSWRPALALLRTRRNLAKVTDALRISAAGVGFPESDRGGWIEIPWSGIEEARVATWRNIKFLHIAFAPGLRADDPGVQGVENAKIWRTLTRPTMGMVGPRFTLGILERSPAEIDAALRLYSGGRVGIS